MHFGSDTLYNDFARYPFLAKYTMCYKVMALQDFVWAQKPLDLIDETSEKLFHIKTKRTQNIKFSRYGKGD